MIRIIARISARSGAEAELRQVLQALVLPSRAEPGCISYELFQDDEHPADFITFENWADRRAAETHLATEHVATAIAQAGNLLAQAPLIHRFTQLA